MHGIGVKAILDLSVLVRDAATEELRQGLLEQLRRNATAYDFGYADQRFRPLAGPLVRADFSGYGSKAEDWRIYDGLSTRLVELTEEGSDNFPEAGLYNGSELTTSPRLLRKAMATVSYRLNHHFAVSEDVVQELVRRAYDDAASRYSEAVRLVVPVVCSRMWSLRLTAPTFKTAFLAYRLLRSGDWKLTTRFHDALLDAQKVLLLEQSVAPKEASDTTDL